MLSSVECEPRPSYMGAECFRVPVINGEKRDHMRLMF